MDSSAVNPEIDDQGAELSLIAALVPSLDERRAIDVGSEHGAVAASLRDAGLGPAWLIEPSPTSAAGLRERFADDSDVHVLEMALGAQDGTAELHLARSASGESLDAFNTLTPERSGPELVWDGSVEVRLRSLKSLSEAGEIPGRVGLLKIDAEGADADVLRGAGGIGADVVMVEFWGDLPDTLGPCPVGLDELRVLVEPLGPRRFLFVRHGRRHVSVGRWDTADPGEGEWGNLIFVADSLVEKVETALPELDRSLRARSERIVAEQERAAAERLELVERLSEEADARLELIERLTRDSEARRGPLERLRGRRRGGGAGGSAGSPRLDVLDDVEQEGRGGGAV